jgi:hypothetical protein
MHIDRYCPGCGGGAGNQPCAVARCGSGRGLEYCYLCDAYPCEKYKDTEMYDSFITHRHQLKDFEKVKAMGLDAYQSQLAEKIEILRYLLANFNDGRRKSFFCLAVNLLELQDVKSVMAQIATETKPDNLTIKEKAVLAANLFQAMAAKRNIILKLNRKTKV